MPRSSRHKSSKHSSRDAKDYYSDSDKDSSFKEKEKEKDRDRKTKDSGSGDKRKLDSKDTSRDLFGSSGNCEHSSEYGSSKRRKERADDGVSERRSGGAGEDDSRAEKTSKASSESKSRRREDVEGDEYKKSRSEGKHRESNKKEERKSREGKSEKLPDDEERRTSKQAAEITDVDVKNQLRSPESHSQLEKRSRRRRDNSGDGHRHQEENGDTLDRHLLSKNEIAKDEKSKDEKYKDEKYKDDYWEATDREERYRDEIYRDERSARDRSDGRSTEKHSRDERDAKEVHRKSKTQDGDREHGHDRERGRDRQREIDLDRDHVHESDRDVNRHDRDYDRHRDRDHYRDRDRSRDVDHDRDQGRRHDRRDRDCDLEQERHETDGDRDRDLGRDREHDGSQLDDRNARHRDRRGRKRSPDDLDDGSDIKPRVVRGHHAQLETKWSSASGSKMESDADIERSMSRSAYADAAMGGNRRSSPNSSYYTDNDEHRQLKQDDPKYMTEQRSKSASKEGTGFSGVAEKSSKYRSMEKSYKTDDAHAADLPAERTSSSKASPIGFIERSSSSTSFERRYTKSPAVRRSLDAEDAAWRSSTPVAAKEPSVLEDKKILDLPSDRPLLDESSQVDSAFHNRATQGNSSLIPPPLAHRSGHANPSFRGPVEEDSRSNSARYKRTGDPTAGRGPGSAWRGVPNWPSPLPNGFMPFHHGPPHGGFQAMMPQFPSPSMFGVRPSMDMSHPGIPFHIPDAERFSGHLRPIGWQNMIDGTAPSHLHGWDGNNVAFRDETHMFSGSEWEQNRNQMAGQGWDANVEMWKGQNGEVDMSLTSQKEDHPAQVRNADVSEGQESQRSPYENSESGIQVKNLEIGSNVSSPAKGSSKSSPETLPDKSAEHPDTCASDDNGGASPCFVYLSKLDISTELANPDVYAQCMSLLDDQQSDGLLRASKVLVNLKDGGRAVLKASIARLSPSFVPSADTSVFQRAMDLYKKQREASIGLPVFNARMIHSASVSDAENRDEKGTADEHVGEKEEPPISGLQMPDTDMQDLNGEKTDVSAAGSLEKLEDLVSNRGVEPGGDDAGELPERVEVLNLDFARESQKESINNFDREKVDEMMSNNAISEDVHGDSFESLDNGDILDRVKETESTH